MADMEHITGLWSDNESEQSLSTAATTNKFQYSARGHFRVHDDG